MCVSDPGGHKQCLHRVRGGSKGSTSMKRPNNRKLLMLLLLLTGGAIINVAVAWQLYHISGRRVRGTPLSLAVIATMPPWGSIVGSTEKDWKWVLASNFPHPTPLRLME